MSGTQIIVEGLSAFYSSYLLAASAPEGPVNSLQGGFDVETIQNRALCWAEDVSSLYQWDENSTAIADNVNVILPSGQSAGTAGRWILFITGSSSSQPIETEFDFILNSRADLVQVVAPVGDVFTLPTGSYAIKVGFSLNANESIDIEAGATVMIMGMGKSKPITGSVASGGIITVSDATSVLDLYNLEVINTGASGIALEITDGTVRASHCCFTGGSGNQAAGVYMAGGEAWLENSITQSGYYGFEGDAGSILHATNTKFLGSANIGVDLDGGIGFLDNCYAFSDAESAACVQNSTGELHATNTRFEVTPTTGIHVVDIAGGKVLRLKNCKITGAGSAVDSGVKKTTANAAETMWIDAYFVNCLNCIEYSSGTVVQAVVSGGADSTCATGINWPSANIPSNGLIVTGFEFNGTTLLSGHTAASARVNYKANLQNGGLATETAIVP